MRSIGVKWLILIGNVGVTRMSGQIAPGEFAERGVGSGMYWISEERGTGLGHRGNHFGAFFQMGLLRRTCHLVVR